MSEDKVRLVLGADGRPTGEAYVEISGPGARLRAALAKDRQVGWEVAGDPVPPVRNVDAGACEHAACSGSVLKSSMPTMLQAVAEIGGLSGRLGIFDHAVCMRAWVGQRRMVSRWSLCWRQVMPNSSRYVEIFTSSRDEADRRALTGVVLV